MKDWYLLTPNSRPNEIGGYENDSFLEYKADAFEESLQTDIACTVTLFNSDLSEARQMRCIIQDNTASTQLKSLERTILASIGSLKAGMYILFENRYWLITGYPGNNKIYEKATMVLCQHKLRWQDDTGKIIERWANYTSASKYDTGRVGNQTIVLTSNNFTVWIPDDDDAATLDGKRVFIDRNDTNPRKVFEITRSDDVLYLYGNEHGGILSFIADKDEFNPETDRQDVGICNYIPLDNSPTGTDKDDHISCVIDGLFILKVGFPRTYQVRFFDNDGNIKKDVEYSWNIEGDVSIKTKELEDSCEIELFTDNESDIGKSFILQVIYNGDVLCDIEINIIEAF